MNTELPSSTAFAWKATIRSAVTTLLFTAVFQILPKCIETLGQICQKFRGPIQNS
jgi:hypothetical protein